MRIDRDELGPMPRAWIPGAEIRELPFEFPRGLLRVFARLVRASSWLGRHALKTRRR